MARSRSLILTTLVIPALAALAIPASASTAARHAAARPSIANANIDGDWQVFHDGKPFDAAFIITGENTVTGSFTGIVTVPPSNSKITHYDITDGVVAGNTFNITSVIPGTVIGENGERIRFAGSVKGNTMTGSETDLELWHNGNKVDTELDGDQDFTATRDEEQVSGEIDLGCPGSGSACSAGGPIEGLEVDVSGDNGSATATTNDDGQWNVEVPSGNYTITPADSDFTFTPDDLKVVVTKNLANQDFQACGESGESASLHEANASGIVYRLAGTDCPAATVSITGKLPPATTIFRWKAKLLRCSKNLGKVTNVLADPPVTVHGLFRGRTTFTRDSSGAITDLRVFSANPNPAYNPIVVVKVNPGYRSGSVVLNGRSLSTTSLINEADKDDTGGEGGFVECYPASGSMGLLPAS